MRWWTPHSCSELSNHYFIRESRWIQATRRKGRADKTSLIHKHTHTHTHTHAHTHTHTHTRSHGHWYRAKGTRILMKSLSRLAASCHSFLHIIRGDWSGITWQKAHDNQAIWDNHHYRDNLDIHCLSLYGTHRQASHTQTHTCRRPVCRNAPFTNRK